MNQWRVGWIKFGLGVLLSFCVEARPIPSLAQGVLETPQPGSFQSGVGLVRGWVCQAAHVDIEVVGRGLSPAVYGEQREDTQTICGDANNGFSFQLNWNELGEGTHTVRALVDGVELGRAQVIVATLGQPYLQGAEGEFVIEPFPQTGKQTHLRWEESRQIFVLASGGPASIGGSSPRTDAKLEDPQPGSFQSGIGLVRGWACVATRIDIELDGRILLPAVYGELRDDTQTVCGDATNGFSLQVNWNDVGDGTHTVRALADGVELGQATFTVVTLGLGSFPRGLAGDFVLNDFPQPLFQTEIRWQESQQNFVVSGARFPGQDEELCTTQSGTATDGSGGNATVSWTNPCLLSGNMAVVRIQVPGGPSVGAFFLCATNFSIQQGGTIFGADVMRLVDFAGNAICRDLPPGSTLDAVLQVDGQSNLNFNSPFAVMYSGQQVVNFSATPPTGAPQLSVSVQDLVFDSTTAEPTQEKSFTVTNAGGGTLMGGMTLMASDSGGQVFSLISGATINVGAGQSQTVTVRFRPVSPDPVTGSVRLTTNGGVMSVRLRSGGQTNPPRLTVSTTTLDFGSVEVPGTADRTFTVTNSGEGILTGSVFPPTVSAFSVIARGTFSLGANQSQTVTIHFAPTAPGTFTGTALVSSNGGEIAVNLTGAATGPKLSVTGLENLFPGGPLDGLLGLDFGNHCGSRTKSFSVQNIGEGTLIGTVTTSPPFQVKKGASFSLRAGQRQKVSIRLKWHPKNGESALGGARIESNGGSYSVPMFASCLKIKIN
ncbi:MAG: choice-of-anchor D domain-containing protein [Deltaproteobacteria bacterium]|nr:choice-of-anchor D domain-containing protein [Deltaproteobacteria bacterium]